MVCISIQDGFTPQSLSTVQMVENGIGTYTEILLPLAKSPKFEQAHGLCFRGSHSPAAQFITTAGYHWLYYRGCNLGHDALSSENASDGQCPIGLLRFRQDGLAHLAASKPTALGVVRTRWFKLRGPKLVVNVDFEGALLCQCVHGCSHPVMPRGA